jgi:sigma-B regulation protein RsbU (phosphoserine phosphatase)
LSELGSKAASLDRSEVLSDLYDYAPCGYVTLMPDGRIGRANATVASWLDIPVQELVGTKFRERLTMPGRILFETHLLPALRMHGEVGEIAVDLLTGASEKLSVFVSANERRADDDALEFTRVIIFKATDRRTFERTLVQSRAEAFKGLADEKATGALREQFIAVLGHDLRNPLASVEAGLRMVSQEPLSSKQARLVNLMQASAQRMSKLIDDVLDLARGQLGNGLTLSIDCTTPLEPMLRQVVGELASTHPEVDIEASIEIERPIPCDPARIGQLVSNLLGNAVSHGAPGMPVIVEATTSSDWLTISVANAGDPIQPAAMAQLFKPFFRGNVRASANGLGLGLHIASMIAEAHGGTLTVSSTEAETRFTFTMPAPST